MTIFLIGMPGSGKSTIGKLLAERLQLPFFDTDEIISNIEECTVSEIFSHKGEAYFRDLEKGLISNWKMTNCVVATGGGLPCIEGCMDIMNEKGKVVYLKSNAQTLASRMENDHNRPLLSNMSGFDREKKLKEMLKQRDVFYNTAKIKVINNGTIDETIVKVLAKLKIK